MTHLLEKFRFVNALPPVADFMSGTVYSAAVNLKGIGRLAFVVQKGVGTTGTSTITVVVGTDNSGPAKSVAVAFNYRRIASNNTTIGDVTAATSSGFVTTAGSADLYIIEVDPAQLASQGFNYAQLKAVESANDPVLGGIIALATDLRYADDTSDIVS